jgi:hypothetical protein
VKLRGRQKKRFADHQGSSSTAAKVTCWEVFILFYRHQSPKCLFNFFLVYIIYYLLKCLLLSAGANRSETVWFAKFRRVADRQSIRHPLGRWRFLSEQDPVRRHRSETRNQKKHSTLAPSLSFSSLGLLYTRQRQGSRLDDWRFPQFG